MKNSAILIVEDESIVAMEIESYLTKLGFSVAGICSTAEDAFRAVTSQQINIVLMDICIKGELDGIESATQIKTYNPHAEIIFLTAHLDDYNVDRAIQINPTGYLSKPFNREELRVFLKIALYKINTVKASFEHPNHHVVLDDEFYFDTFNDALYCCQEVIHLTKKEMMLLSLLIQYKNNVVDFYTIENIIWPDKITDANTIRTLVKRVRQKLKHKFIESIPSRGYRLNITT